MPEQVNEEKINNPPIEEGMVPEQVGESDGSIYYKLHSDSKNPVPELRTVEGRVRTYKAMSTNSTIGGILLAFKSLCKTAKFTVDQDPDDPQETRAKDRATFLNECIKDMQTPFIDVVSEILEMLDMGFKVMVPQFKARTGQDRDPNYNSRYHDGKVGWKSFMPIDPETIQEWVTPNGEGYLGLTGITQMSSSTGKWLTIPRNRMLLFRTTSINNDPTGKSILASCVKDWVRLEDAEQIQMTGLRRSLEGIPYARIHTQLAKDAQNNATARAAIQAAKKAVMDIDSRKDNGFILPADRDENGHLKVEVKMIGSQEGGGNTRIQDAKLVIEDKQHSIARSMLAQFMTIQGKGGSYALSKNQSEIFISSLQGYMTQIEEVLNNEAIPRLFAANGEGLTNEDRYLPTIKFSKFVKEDISEFFSALQQSVEMGLFEVTEQIQKKAGEMLNIDTTGQSELLEKRRAKKEAMEDLGSEEEVGGSPNGGDIPETDPDSITDENLNSIINE